MRSQDDYFAYKTLKAISTRWPEWEKYLQPRDHHRKRGFWIEIPVPRDELTRGLSVLSVGDQIIIGFDDDHDHLRPKKRERLSEFRNRVVNRLGDLFADRIFAISWRRDGSLCTSIGFRPRDQIKDNRFINLGMACRIRSWSGQHDQDFIET